MITRQEYGLLKEYRRLGYKWIARDKNGRLFVFQEIPRRYRKTWNFGGVAVNIREEYFTFIKWEDEKPTSIADLINEYEQHETLKRKAVIPQYVADWIEEVKALERSFKLELLFDTTEMPDDVFDWLDERYGDTDILAKAWLDGYEVEKDKLYYIEFSENQYAQRFDESNIDSILVNDKALAGRFTEEQIKKINPRFWLLAVEVSQ